MNESHYEYVYEVWGRMLDTIAHLEAQIELGMTAPARRYNVRQIEILTRSARNHQRRLERMEEAV
jgi:hypothetical protein